MLQLAQLFLSEGKLELSSEDDLIWKTVLRTGRWEQAPTPDGSPLVVVRDGPSDTKKNVISLSEIVEAFDAEAFEYVTVPLAANIAEGDHADIARNNTGFVRKLKIVDEDGVSKLKAGFDFTEPDIKERVQRGTIPNTSVGIAYDFTRKSDAKKFATALSHVALTHRPIIDKMEPFGIAASDGEGTEVTSFEPLEDVEWKESQSYEFIKNKVAEVLADQMGSAYEVSNVMPGVIRISNTLGGLEWQTAYTIDGDKAILPPITEWLLVDSKKIEAQVEPVQDPEPVAEIKPESEEILDPEDLWDAHLLREKRFSQGTNSKRGLDMSSINDLNGLNLSDLPDDVRAAVEAMQERNRELERKNREEAVEAQIKAWGELGLSDTAFLKTARRIMLSDEGATAALLLSDNENPRDEKVTATEIVERLVNALPKSEEGKIELAAQVDVGPGPGHHQKPPETDEPAPFEDRLAEARQFLGKSE